MLAERVLSAGILVLLAVPGLRVGASSAYRRVFPFDSIRIGSVSLSYVAAVVALAVYQPAWLRLPAVFAAFIAACFLWRFRAGYGVASGLPPGSLYPLPIGPWHDAEFYGSEAARYGDVFKMSQFGQPMVCIVGLGRANRLLLEHDKDLVAPPLPFSRFIDGGYLRYLPEQTHQHYRKFFRSMFHSDVTSLAKPRLAATFHDGFREMAQVSADCGSAQVRKAILKMMFAAWTDLFYGIDAHHADFARLKELSRVIDIRRARWARRKRIDSALSEIETILRHQADRLMTDPTPRACFLASLARDNPEALLDRTVLGNLVYIMQVSWGDVSGLLFWTFKMLSDHPEWRHRLEASPSHELATRIIQETLRLEQSESRYRRATADIELDGFRIPKNWLIRICIRESHRNESVFPDPLTFNPDRFIGRAPTRAEYAPFGAFRLACIGEELTKHVGVQFVIALVGGFEWSVVSDAHPRISSWAHNAPSSTLSVNMTAKPAFSGI